MQTTTEGFAISRYELGRILGRNFRGVQRLAQIEFKDALNVSCLYMVVYGTIFRSVCSIAGDPLQSSTIQNGGGQTVCQQRGRREEEQAEESRLGLSPELARLLFSTAAIVVVVVI